MIVILGRLDLFTEFTTIAAMPMLKGQATVWAVSRFWSIIYLGNVFGAGIFGVLIVALAAQLQVNTAVLADIAGQVSRQPWWAIVLSAFLAGWLMGMLSWLIAGGRDTTSQILFTILIAYAIGLGHLHHAIVGTAEVVVGLLVESGIGLHEAVHFMAWTTVGNALGGVVFAAAILTGSRSSERVAQDDGDDG